MLKTGLSCSRTTLNRARVSTRAMKFNIRNKTAFFRSPRRFTANTESSATRKRVILHRCLIRYSQLYSEVGEEMLAVRPTSDHFLPRRSSSVPYSLPGKGVCAMHSCTSHNDTQMLAVRPTSGHFLPSTVHNSPSNAHESDFSPNSAENTESW